ncbi:uncharacterized protein LOC131886121 [Tigriopus californicus]|uniref:uncharacterized protein LOC131886121 n=1 Tax=Tigriopus californicus TaxID=6832 RepID=UPI0027D9F86C|nr:uncharacterized protein LOC131886121 [Tigriopus californicus]
MIIVSRDPGIYILRRCLRRPDPVEMSKLKRRRGQHRFRTIQALEGLREHISEHENSDPNALELWMFDSLEGDIQSLETRIEAYSEAHLEVLVHHEVHGRKDVDEDESQIRDMQSGLLTIERKHIPDQYILEACHIDHGHYIGKFSSVATDVPGFLFVKSDGPISVGSTTSAIAWLHGCGSNPDPFPVFGHHRRFRLLFFLFL